MITTQDMAAGPELNTRIATLLQWTPAAHEADLCATDGYWCFDCEYHGDTMFHMETVPRFSEDWGAAGTVVEWLHDHDWYIEPIITPGAYPVSIHLWRDVFDAAMPTVDVEAATFPLAICRAALEASVTAP
jgi:hypothetical protein